MESNFTEPAPETAADTLKMLSTDNDRLSQRRVPWVLLAGFGAVAAWFVAAAATTTPGGEYEPPATLWLALVVTLTIAHLIQKETGIRFQKVGTKATLAFVGIIVAGLALFSASFGLVALGATWAVAVTSLSAFVITTLLARVAYDSALERLRSE